MIRVSLSAGLAFITLAFSTTLWAQQTARPERVVGRDKCKGCHASEFKAWEHSSHNTKAWAALDHPKAAGFAKAIGVTNIKGDSACTQCHGTQSLVGGVKQIAKGNSCESCHGGAGGSGAWLETHCDFGSGRKIDGAKMASLLSDRAKETKEHRATRNAATKKSGMRQSSDLFDLAANCVNCHSVPNEKLVEAGHPISGRFEFVEWSQGEVRHNFLLNSRTNADVPTSWSDPTLHGAGRKADDHKKLMYVAGQLADLAISLKNRSTVTSTKRGTLGDEMNDRILDLTEELEELEIAELKPAIAAVKGFNKKSLRKVTSGDKKTYLTAAGLVARAARKVLKTHQDGGNLPDSIEVISKTKGEAYKP